MSYHHTVPPHLREQIVVHDHDVLSGRGVNIAQHPGNQRYRTLISTRKDDDYCEKYTTTEKRAVAEEVIKHIHSLDPPGRFLKREGGSKGNRGLSGPWEVLNHDACVKKVTQALRDCNRQDREGYAKDVPQPEDVAAAYAKRKQSGLTNKQQAAAAAGAVAAHMAAHTQFGEAGYGAMGAMGGGPGADQLAAAAAMNGGRVSPTMAEAAHTLYAKRQRTEDGHVPMPHDASLINAHHHLPPQAAATADHTHYQQYQTDAHDPNAVVSGESAAAAVAASWASQGQSDVPSPAARGAHGYPPPPMDSIPGEDEHHVDQLEPL